MSQPASSGNPLFPVFLKLDEILTVVVGGGNVGLEKLEALLKNDPNARVRLVAPEIRDEIKKLADLSPNIELIERKFEYQDLEDAGIAILATDNPELHKEIREWSKERHLLLNVADTPHLCDFYLGSTVKKGNLKIGISTNGQSPTFAKRLREILEESLPDETDQLLEKLKLFRDKLKGDFQDKVKKLNELTSTLVKK
ncbi:MAG: bifunctional precorrin-2 dehydrogenase/sirohydrochlorin ferrochelatase [Cyclobacteriaceae bacterium]|nr:bifunctional precorrin-2 dehydrogenase/sirohydrochlorin ferrochelatase [Cyclobacteriaceae bacterium SS2]